MAASRLLYGVPVSQPVRAVLWLCASEKLPIELRKTIPPAQTRSDEYLALNPRGKIPLLQEGDFLLAEGVAIASSEQAADTPASSEARKPRKKRATCEHGRQRNRCKDCGGGSICEHGRQRRTCKACGGSQICPHGRVRCQCKDCGGSSVCEHGRQRHRCKECGGNRATRA